MLFLKLKDGEILNLQKVNHIFIEESDYKFNLCFYTEKKQELFLEKFNQLKDAEERKEYIESNLKNKGLLI